MIRLNALGSINLFDEKGRAIGSVLAQSKRLALLSFLAMSPHGHCRRDTVLGLFWPDYDTARARTALRQAIRFLRRELGNRVIRNIGNQCLAIDRLSLTSDAQEFERACDGQQLEDALHLYQGDFAAGLFVIDASPDFDTWLESERVRLRQRALKAVSELIARNRAHGCFALAAHWSWRAIALAPDDECLLRALLELLADAGDSAGAIRAYEHFASMIKRDLGMSPSARTQQLAATIRSSARLYGIATETASASAD